MGLLGRTFAGIFLFGITSVVALEPVTLQFETPNVRPDNQSVSESGYLFSGRKHPAVVNGGGLSFLNPNEGNGGGGISTRPVNGTTYAVPFTGALAVLERNDGAPFRLHEFDVAEYSTSFDDPFTLSITGYRVGGGVVSTTFEGDGYLNGFLSRSDFERVTLGEEWSSLLRVEMFVRWHLGFAYLGFCIDNIELSRSPVIDFEFTEEQMMVDYAGVIQESTNMVQWVDMVPQPTPPFSLNTDEPVRFFRARDE